jgi:putative ABC transport system permease protein
VLTRAKALQYLGSAQAIGRRLTLVLDGAAHDYRVTAVLADPPAATDLKFDFMVPFTPALTPDQTRWRHWGSQQLETYLRFKTPAAAQVIAADLDHFVDRHAGSSLPPPIPHATMGLPLRPLLTLHLRDPKDAAVVAALGAVGVLVALMAAVNHVNLATVGASMRAREVALRKVMGSTRRALVAQFMGEAVATVALAALLALGLCELALPAINAMSGLSLRLDYGSIRGVLPLLLVAVALISLCAGIYPALVLSSFQPAAVLASARAPGGGRAGGRVRQGLVVFQFAIAIAFTISTAVIVAETRFIRNADLGFERQGLIIVNSFDDPTVTSVERSSLLAAWRGLPGVEGVTAGDIAPGNDDSSSASGTKRLGAPGDGISIQYVTTRPDFLRIYGARLVAGRLLDRRHGADDMDGAEDIEGRTANVVLNVNAVGALGFESPRAALGQKLTDGAREFVVVGVIDNIRFRTPRAAIPSTIYAQTTAGFSGMVAGVRYAATSPDVVMASLVRTWRQIAPDAPFRAETSAENLQPYYDAAERQGRLFTLGAALTVLIGCLGLYGLASFNTARRYKEIGIRKTLGASTGEVLRLLLVQVLRPVAAANLLAWPLAYVAMRGWLAGFDQRVALSPLYFIAATVLALAVAALTVLAQSLRLARAEPAKALRHE